MDYLIQDLKTDRPNISAGLPPVYRLVPVALYASLVLAVGLNAMFVLNIRSNQAEEKSYQEMTAIAQAEQSDLVARQSAITQETTAATQISDWLAGARPVQPVGITIARSIEGNASIAELNMERNPQMPSHLFLTLKINGGGTSQIDSTLNALSALHYQTYSAQQVKATNAIDFSATLIWNDRS